MSQYAVAAILLALAALWVIYDTIRRRRGRDHDHERGGDPRP